MSKKSFHLLLALSLSYFGDYCGFVALLELARQLSGAEESILAFLVYSLPAVLMIVFSRQWSAISATTKTQLVAVNILGFLSAGIVGLIQSRELILFVALLLGLVKEVARTLANSFIKEEFSTDEQPKLINNAVGLRFVIMIFGGSLGAFLVSEKMYELCFFIQAFTFLVAMCLFATFKTKTTDKLRVSAPSLNAKDFVQFVGLLNWRVFVLYSLSLIAVGAFMSVEYPLITSHFGIAPSMIGLVYAGHVVGAIAAMKILNNWSEKFAGHFVFLVVSLVQILSFLLVGLVGKSITMLSVQIGLCALMMVIFESSITNNLMKNTSAKDYSLYNIWLRSSGLLAEFMGSLVMFAVVKKFDLHMSNVWICATSLFIGFIVLLSLLPFKRKLVTLALACLMFTSCSKTKDSELVKNISMSTVDSVDKKANYISEQGNKIVQSFKDRASSATKQSENILAKLSHSSYYLPKRSSSKDKELIWISKLFAAYDADFESITSNNDFISWIYFYDSFTKLLMISPSTNTQVLFGDDMIFDDFDFYKRAVSSFPKGSFTALKDDINGTGSISIYTQAIQRDDRKYTTLSIDLNVSRLLRNTIRDVLDSKKEYLGRKYFYLVYEYNEGKGQSTPLIADYYSIDSKLSDPTQFHGLLKELAARPGDVVDKRINGSTYVCSSADSKVLTVKVAFCIGN